jgi:hypothetical protein
VGWQVLTGVPGVYLVGLASIGEPKWLYIPGLPLMGAGVVLELLSWRRVQSTTGRLGFRPPDSGGSARKRRTPRS